MDLLRLVVNTKRQHSTDKNIFHRVNNYLSYFLGKKLHVSNSKCWLQASIKFDPTRNKARFGSRVAI